MTLRSQYYNRNANCYSRADYNFTPSISLGITVTPLEVQRCRAVRSLKHAHLYYRRANALPPV